MAEIEIIICKNCALYKKHWQDNRCLAPQARRMNYVTGENIDLATHCESVNADGKCEYFKAKPTRVDGAGS